MLCVLFDPPESILCRRRHITTPGYHRDQAKRPQTDRRRGRALCPDAQSSDATGRDTTGHQDRSPGVLSDEPEGDNVYQYPESVEDQCDPVHSVANLAGPVGATEDDRV